MNEIDFNKLLDNYLSGKLNAAEKKEFLRMLREERFSTLLDQRFSKTWNVAESEYLGDDTDLRITKTILDKVRYSEKQAGKEISYRLYKWVAAASIILVAGLFIFQYQSKKSSSENASKFVIEDISSPASQAVLHLADGKIVTLDRVRKGRIGIQGSSEILQNENGEISYRSTGTTSEIIYNTLSVPRGSKVISLQLNDGTKVWLNAESSLKYPVAFNTKERTVSITGEAYFEVAKDAKRTFLVHSGNTVTKVLGTNFNINAYEIEKGVQVSLLEGSVKVENKKSATLIIPGQQALIKESEIAINRDINMEVVVAWKNDIFNFNNQSLTSIMQQIGRWYNVEVEYEGEVKQLNFGGRISRKENVSTVLRLLEKTEVVKFRIEPSKKNNGKIIVTIL